MDRSYRTWVSAADGPGAHAGAIRVLAVCGSLRESSANGALLRAAAALSNDALDVRLYDSLGEIPPFNPDLDGDPPPPAVAEYRAALQASEAVLIASPEYAHGAPGVLKNALDWVVGSGELIGKPVSVISASPHAMFAQASLTETLKVMSARVVPAPAMVVPFGRRTLDPGDVLADIYLSAALRSVLGLLARAARSQRAR